MGQGACSGMRDGINLAWKLDLMLTGRASDDLLDTFEAERRPHVTAITQMSLFLGHMVNEDDPRKVAERDAAFRSGNMPPMPPFPKLEHGIVHDEADGTRLPTTGAPAPQGRARGAAEGRFDDVVGRGFQLVARTPFPLSRRRAACVPCAARLSRGRAVRRRERTGCRGRPRRRAARVHARARDRRVSRTARFHRVRLRWPTCAVSARLSTALRDKLHGSAASVEPSAASAASAAVTHAS